MLFHFENTTNADSPSVLGASLHDILTRLKAEPQSFPKLDVLYSPDQPVTEPVCLELPQNGIRLRFDGPEQRLRLIEVTDFTKNHITFKDRDLVRPVNGTSAPGSPMPGESSSGPTFRHVYHRLLGPTYGGEFIPPAQGQQEGIYVLSYPGVAFNFALAASSYTPDKDVVALLSSYANQGASSMAIFSGDSWADARKTLWTEILPSIKATSALPRTKDIYPDEVSLAQLHGGGKIQLSRKWGSSSSWIILGETTPQDLVMELGPPNAIYQKNDQKMVIHKMRTTSNARTRPSASEMGRIDDLTDTDQSSMNTGSEDSGDDEAIQDETVGSSSGECFYNYFYHGFDVLLSPHPANVSPDPPGQGEPDTKSPEVKTHTAGRLVATKIVLHGNIPGSYEFNRHRRCRWSIAYLGNEITSESHFADIEPRMAACWAGRDGISQQQPQHPRGMVLNRGWGDSPGSSCELLGGWEESGARRADANGESTTTTLYGFPGMVFEVLKNGYVNTVTVF